MNDKDRAIGEVVKDTTAPLMVTDAINKLCRRYGTNRVREAVRAWLEFIDSADAKARLDKWEKGGDQ